MHPGWADTPAVQSSMPGKKVAGERFVDVAYGTVPTHIGIVLIPIRIRLSILMPLQIRIPILPKVLRMLENQNIFCLNSLLHQHHRCHNSQYFGQSVVIF
jgi:hypothetical protein